MTQTRSSLLFAWVGGLAFAQAPASDPTVAKPARERKFTVYSPDKRNIPRKYQTTGNTDREKYILNMCLPDSRVLDYLLTRKASAARS
jgi:hypothetical protein